MFGGDIPTEIWTAYMRNALTGRPDLPFPTPAPLGHGTNEPGVPSPSPSPSPNHTKHAGRPDKRPPTTFTPRPGQPTTGAKCHAHKCR